LSSEKEASELPQQVEDLLQSAKIGYLSVMSKKGESYTYPMTFYLSGSHVYFMTPISAAKLKFMRANPNVSFLVDNHEVTTISCGAMIQGKAQVFSVAKTVISIVSTGPKMAHFARKYPGMFTFYAKGKGLPDERKLYKYRLIRIQPSKIIFWMGYKFGRVKPKGESKDSLSQVPEEERLDTISQMMEAADEELPSEPIQHDEGWLEGIDQAAKRGILSNDEQTVLRSYRTLQAKVTPSNRFGPKPTEAEKKLLAKWKASR
jgi:hypothetical protein